MTIIQGLLGEHGAMYPLLDMIESTAPSAGLEELKVRASCLRSTLTTHADLEDELLKPVILPYLPKTACGPTDHEVIDAGLAEVLIAADAEAARRALLDTVAHTRKHFHKEETIIFGIAERKLTEAHREELGAEWARRRGVSLN